jgi:hypothetical protein
MLEHMKNLLRLAVLVIGTLAIIGYTFESEPFKNAARRLAASPLPIVFSRFGSQENFTGRILVSYTEKDGGNVEKELRPEDFKIAGPYARRGVYVGIYSIGAHTDIERPRQEILAIMKRGICGGGPLADLLKIPDDVQTVRMKIEPREETATAEEFTIGCSNV